MFKENKRYKALYKGNRTYECRKVKYCILCFAPIHTQQNIYYYLKAQNNLCGNCLRALEVANRQVRCNGYRIYLLYVYNAFIENMIFQYKEGRDIALAPVFFHMVVRQLHSYFRNYVIVLMPSSKEKTLERGFHSLYEMLCYCKLPIIDPFYKTANHKQSLQSFENRKKISQVIKLKPDYILPNKKLLLVDDVCTSGSTLAHAYHLLKHHKRKIDAFVLSAHPRFIHDCEKEKRCKKGIFHLQI